MIEKEYLLLHETVRKWIDDQDPKWENLHTIQRIVIPELLEEYRDGGERDFIVAAPTATGKTEAVFLPIATVLAEQTASEARTGAEVLYICPLTVLIDQQAKRLSGMFPADTHPVTPWHGSSSRAGKKRFENRPSGVLIITPESLESQLINRLNTPSAIEDNYGALRLVVIDELHAFFDSPRGYQLLSQLSRLEYSLGRTVSRIGLSATFASDVEDAIKPFLRPEDPGRVVFLRDSETARDITYHVGCFAEESPLERSANRKIVEQINEDFAPLALTEGTEKKKGLVFVNSRQESEHFSHHLSEFSEASENGELVFHPHHGSLSPKQKELAIEAINEEGSATVLVCTTTLELGLDIGSISQVGQIDPGATVSSLQQRLGRSGRKHGQVSKLLVYVRESDGGREARTLDALHLPTFQALAQISLVKRKAFEAPDRRPAHLSTLIQQILSFARQRGSITESEAREVFLEKGPFLRMRADQQGHLELLFARLEQAGLLERQNLSGETEPPYHLTATGMGLMDYHQFFAAFQTRTEYSVYGPGEAGLLGRIPLGNSYKVGDQIIFARRLWSITSINKLNRMIRVVDAGMGQAPVFPGDPITPSEEVIDEMFKLYAGEIDPPPEELSSEAARFFEEGRDAFSARRLAKTSAFEESGGVLIFPWAADRIQTSLLLSLRYWGLSAIPAKLAIFVRGADREELRDVLARLATPTSTGERPRVPSDTEAARNAGSLGIDKHDHYLSPYLKRWNFASFRLNQEAIPQTAAKLLKRLD
jgi:ATP-dependent Lhr-like helicase